MRNFGEFFENPQLQYARTIILSRTDTPKATEGESSQSSRSDPRSEQGCSDHHHSDRKMDGATDPGSDGAGKREDEDFCPYAVDTTIMSITMTTSADMTTTMSIIITTTMMMSADADMTTIMSITMTASADADMIMDHEHHHHDGECECGHDHDHEHHHDGECGCGHDHHHHHAD